MMLLKIVVVAALLSVGFAITGHADQAWMVGPIMITYYMARGAWWMTRKILWVLE